MEGLIFGILRYVQILENGVMKLQKRRNTISLDFTCLCSFQSLSYVSLV